MYTKVIRFDCLHLWRDYNRAIGKRIVATNGCFDILHRGHVTYLRKAKELGDILIVGVNSDRSVRELKGEGRPVNCQEDRAAVVAALEVVDHVVIFDDLRAMKFLSIVRPDTWVKGGDYSDETLDRSEVETVKRQGGNVVIVPIVAGYSTTRSIALIEAAEAEKDGVVSSDVSRRDEASAPGDSGGVHQDPSEEPGAILRAPESLRPKRSLAEIGDGRD